VTLVTSEMAAKLRIAANFAKLPGAAVSPKAECPINESKSALRSLCSLSGIHRARPFDSPTTISESSRAMPSSHFTRSEEPRNEARRIAENIAKLPEMLRPP
jgi:hypothetical protein